MDAKGGPLEPLEPTKDEDGSQYLPYDSKIFGVGTWIVIILAPTIIIGGGVTFLTIRKKK